MHFPIDIKLRDNILNFRHLSEEADRSYSLVIFKQRRNETKDSDLFFFDRHPVDGRPRMGAGQDLFSEGRENELDWLSHGRLG
jgi:hypothetical protein